MKRWKKEGRDQSTHRMKMMTPGADIKRFPLMTEARVQDRRRDGGAEYTIHRETGKKLQGGYEF